MFACLMFLSIVILLTSENMKLITLNTWGGRAGKEGLLAFFDAHKNDVDIFCLQEILSAPYEHLEGHDAGGKRFDHTEIMVRGMQEISGLLSDHSTFFVRIIWITTV